MKKPEKRNGNFDNTPWCSACGKSEDFCTCEGYNDCCDAVEKWLPNEEEIENIIIENLELLDGSISGIRATIEKIAKAISKRLRGEK